MAELMDRPATRTGSTPGTFIAIAAAILPAGSAPRAQHAQLRVPYTQFTLPNGLHVILHEDHAVPLVTVSFAVVIIGDRKVIEPRIRALDLGALTLVEPTEVMK